jgi:pimeloyl-ACP methyl ester carboxylesterase
MERATRIVGVVAALVALTACTSPTPPAPSSEPAGEDIAQSFDVGGRQMYLECHGSSSPGRPTVVLISGYHDAGDVWDISELITPPAVGPTVPEALATGHRVCTYDRPGTIRYSGDTPVLTDRSTPVPQPRTAADVVAELHALLAAAEVPGPYLLTAHSLGGLFAQLYARTYPDDVRGIVFVDAFSATVPEVFGARWPLYRDILSAVPPGTPLDRPEAEKIDIDRSVAQVAAAEPLPAIPVVVLTKTEPFETALPPPPGLPWEDTNRLFEQAETALVQLRPDTPHIFATGSDHYIQWHDPDLVVTATELVAHRAPG